MVLGRVRTKAQRLVSKIRNRISPPALILMYHRIAEADSDPWSLCVTPKHFAEHLEVLRHYGTVLSLQQLTSKLRDCQSIARSIVITFDDGYADNFYHAQPLLAAYETPATVFITTGSIDQNHEFWWDELERLLLQPGTLPNRLQFDGFHWELGEATDYSQMDFQRDRAWRMERGSDPTPRHALYRLLYKQLQFLSTPERANRLDQIRAWANAEPVVRPTHRSLSHPEMLALESEGLVEIGAHTVTHPFLAHLSIAAQQAEIQRSKDQLERILGHPITSFSYPNGSYTSETISIVQSVGFDCACCSIAHPVQSKSDRFLLPRIVVEDWNGETFARWLSQQG
jgi:peptidoglycan/xylan/chitin deacetylase (PgdA/CDA1 family)